MKKAALILQKYYKTTSLLCGLLLTLALPPYYLYFSAIAAFSIFFWLLNCTESKRKACAVGYWFGFGFFAGGFYWISNALLIDMTRTGWLYPITLFLNGAFFGLFTILPALAGASKKLRSLTARMLCFAAVWGISTEWIRSFIFSGFPWNPLSSILLFDINAAQALSVFGTYGLSALTAFVLVFPARFLLLPNWKNFALSVCVSLIFPLGLIFYGHSVIPSASDEQDIISVRLVQPSLPQTADWSRERAEKEFNEHVNLSKEAAENGKKVDFVIWGETASPFDLTYDKEHLQKAGEIVPEGGYLISGMLHHEFEADGYYKVYNSLALIDGTPQVVDFYSKNHLVPFGEFIPFREFLPKFVRPVTNMVAEFGRGEKYQIIAPEGFAKFAPLICYEIIFSDNIVTKNNDLKWMVVLTFDGWYGESSGPYQHLAAAQMRAIEEGINIVRSANSGVSAVISAYGEICAELGLNKRGVLDADVPLYKAHKTLFGKYGNLMLLSVIALLILAAFSSEAFSRLKK